MRGMRADRRGVMALEFALVAPALILLLLGGIELGLLMWTRNALQVAAIQTARCVALGAPPCGTTPADYAAYAANKVRDWSFGLSSLTATVAPAGSTCYGSNGGYSGYTMVTLSSQQWAGSLIAPLTGTTLSASACFPSPS